MMENTNARLREKQSQVRGLPGRRSFPAEVLERIFPAVRSSALVLAISVFFSYSGHPRAHNGRVRERHIAEKRGARQRPGTRTATSTNASWQGLTAVGRLVSIGPAAERSPRLPAAVIGCHPRHPRFDEPSLARKLIGP